MVIEYRTEADHIEYFDGERHPKVSARWAHGTLQAQLAYLLVACGARQYGTVASEQDAVIGKRDGTNSKLIPDVSFSRFEQFRGLSPEDREEPPFSPAIAIEVWSRGDSRKYLERKIARFLETGSELVLDIHPKNQTVAAHTIQGVTHLHRGERFTSNAFPWFEFNLDELFSVVDALPPELREL